MTDSQVPERNLPQKDGAKIKPSEDGTDKGFDKRSKLAKGGARGGENTGKKKLK